MTSAMPVLLAGGPLFDAIDSRAYPISDQLLTWWRDTEILRLTIAIIVLLYLGGLLMVGRTQISMFNGFLLAVAAIPIMETIVSIVAGFGRDAPTADNIIVAETMLVRIAELVQKICLAFAAGAIMLSGVMLTRFTEERWNRMLRIMMGVIITATAGLLVSTLFLTFT